MGSEPSDQQGLPESDDWFMPAIECEGNVHASLTAVMDELEYRQSFMQALRQQLCGAGDGGLDSLTLLGREVSLLENTLRFRLGILRPERQGAWFRDAQKSDLGPFRTNVLHEPVFASYRIEQVPALKLALRKSWEEALPGPLPFADDRPCLWNRLIDLKVRLRGIVQLPAPFADSDIPKLAARLPARLESRTLLAFLKNVCREYDRHDERLGICFEQLWEASEKLWSFQQSLKETHRQQGARSASRQRQQPRPGAVKDTLLGFKDMEALKILGFQRLPTASLLKKRYLELAKEHHPDRHGGSDETFKRVNGAFQRLQTKL